MRLLVVEDDRKLSELLQRGLGEEGHAATCVRDGASGLARLRAEAFDACILDVGLPDLDGFTVLERARGAGVTTPILMLTARDAVPDRVRGLELGADDYLLKPFAFAELSARLAAIARRGSPARPQRLKLGRVELDPGSHRVTVGGELVELSQKQFSLLELLLRHAGQVVTRQMVLREVFGYGFDPGTNLVDVHVSKLRQQLEHPALDIKISSVRGVGYRLDPDGA